MPAAVPSAPLPRPAAPPGPLARWLARWHGGLLAALWLALQVLCWHLYRAPRPDGDTHLYLEYAEQLLATGRFGGGHVRPYAGYAAFVAIFLKLGWGRTGIWLGQVSVSGLAAAALYRTVRRLRGGAWPAAALATLLLVGWLEIQRFNAFLLTESLFTSLLIFSLWAVSRVRGWGSAALAGLVLLATATVRPNGFVALAAAGAAGLAGLWARGGRARGLAMGLALTALPLAWLGLNGLLASFDLIEGYQKGIVIFGYAPGYLHPAAPLLLPAPEAAPLAKLAYFIQENPRYFGQLAALKLTYFMGWPKPFYSGAHALFALLTLPAIYWLGLRGLARRTAPRPVRVYLATALLLQAGIVALTVEDWDIRFSAPLLPYWFALAALGWGRKG